MTSGMGESLKVQASPPLQALPRATYLTFCAVGVLSQEVALLEVWQEHLR